MAWRICWWILSDLNMPFSIHLLLSPNSRRLGKRFWRVWIYAQQKCFYAASNAKLLSNICVKRMIKTRQHVVSWKNNATFPHCARICNTYLVACLRDNKYANPGACYDRFGRGSWCPRRLRQCRLSNLQAWLLRKCLHSLSQQLMPCPGALAPDFGLRL